MRKLKTLLFFMSMACSLQAQYYNPYNNPYNQAYNQGVAIGQALGRAIFGNKSTQRQSQSQGIKKRLCNENEFTWYEIRDKGTWKYFGAEDANNKTLIPLSREYEYVSFRNETGHIGYFSIKKDGKYGVCDITGREIVPPISNGSCIYVDEFEFKNSSGDWERTGWYLDENGIATREAPIKKFLQTESDGFKWYRLAQGEKNGAEDYMNRTLIPLSRGYTDVYYRSEKGHRGFFGIKKGDRWGVCDIAGKELVEPKYSSFLLYVDGFQYENSEGKWENTGWMLDSEGRGIRGSKKSITNNGVTYYIVSREGVYGLTDANSKEIVPMEMEAIEAVGGNRLKFKQNGSWGLLNFLGKIVVPTTRGYTSIGKYSKTQKTFAYTMDGYKGECDGQGRELSRIKVAQPPKKTITSTSVSASKSSSSSQGDCEMVFDSYELNGKKVNKKATLEIYHNGCVRLKYGNESLVLFYGKVEYVESDPYDILNPFTSDEDLLIFTFEEFSSRSMTLSESGIISITVDKDVLFLHEKRQSVFKRMKNNYDNKRFSKGIKLK